MTNGRAPSIGDRLVIATHNTGKLREIGDLVRPFGVAVISVGELGLPEPAETGATFAENAGLKARAAAEASGLPALADDSGLVVPALGGAPGLYTADWAGGRRDWGLAMRKLAHTLRPTDDRGASFVCTLALAWPDGTIRFYEGEVAGRLVWPARGTNGFGYDPMFVPEDASLTFGEMAPEEKHRMNHRARAFALLSADLSAPNGG